MKPAPPPSWQRQDRCPQGQRREADIKRTTATLVDEMQRRLEKEQNDTH